MIKLYLRAGERITNYHEAWESGTTITEHWGQLGTRGNSREHLIAPGKSIALQLQDLLAPARARGYAEVEDKDHAVLLVEYEVTGMGSTTDLDKRYELEDWQNEFLGWTGLGDCDGGSIGSGTMEACCYVVDFEVAKQSVAKPLKGTKFEDYSRIYREGA
jgi:hypothetical protein